MEVNHVPYLLEIPNEVIDNLTFDKSLNIYLAFLSCKLGMYYALLTMALCISYDTCGHTAIAQLFLSSQNQLCKYGKRAFPSFHHPTFCNALLLFQLKVVYL